MQVISSQGLINLGDGNLGWLHTDGRYIKDASGGIVNFVGTTEAQTTWANPATYQYWKHGGDPIPMAERMAELGVTWVRICVTYGKWIDPTTDADGKSYKDWIDDYVREFTSRGIYSMVGNMGHEFTDPDNLTPWLNFLTELANRYKDNPGMSGIYIYNEPPSPPFSLDVWHQVAPLGAQAVHDANPNLLILVHGDLPNREGIDPYWISNPIPIANVVYVFHDYFWQNLFYDHRDFAENYASGNYELAKQQMEQSMYDRYFKYAVEYNICIMNEEFGFNDDSRLQPGDMYWTPGYPQSVYDYMDLMEKYQVPWNQYCWWVNNGESYGLAQESDYYTLSPVGEIWTQGLTNT